MEAYKMKNRTGVLSLLAVIGNLAVMMTIVGAVALS